MNAGSRETDGLDLQILHFEDFTVGRVWTFGPIEVSGEDIIAFARQFDPQPFHTDPEAARNSGFGQLVASGWHTASLAMRLLVDNILLHAASLYGPGVDDLRWPNPVVPGDRLTLRVEVAAARRSAKAPGRGLVTLDLRLLNQRGDPVMTQKGPIYFRTRTDGAESPR